METHTDGVSLDQNWRGPFATGELFELGPRFGMKRKVDLLVFPSRGIQLFLERIRVRAVGVSVQHYNFSQLSLRSHFLALST